MARTVLVAEEHSYEDNRLGIFITVILSSGAEEVELLAKIDTGADVCVSPGISMHSNI